MTVAIYFGIPKHHQALVVAKIYNIAARNLLSSTTSRSVYQWRWVLQHRPRITADRCLHTNLNLIEQKQRPRGLRLTPRTTHLRFLMLSGYLCLFQPIIWHICVFFPGQVRTNFPFILTLKHSVYLWYHVLWCKHIFTYYNLAWFPLLSTI
jgi:hypothetical protein